LGVSQGDASLETDCALLGSGGSIVLFFKDNAISDINGPDIFVFEKGAAIEPTNLEISKNGVNWINIGKIEGGTGSKDISNFVKQGETFNYIRLTDLKTSFGPPPGADIDAVAAIGGALRMNLDSAVLFETGKHVLKEEGVAAIKELALQMTMLEKGLITVEGHTDDVGSSDSNKTLSRKRAASVAVELKKALPDPNFKWKEVGYGESRPLVKNDSDENRQKNRRVEILVIPN
jgi:outer membrane protein OmpA-like peptidoglycan-associated protein